MSWSLCVLGGGGSGGGVWYALVVVAGEGLVEVHELRGAVRGVQQLAAPLQDVAAALQHHVRALDTQHYIHLTA